MANTGVDYLSVVAFLRVQWEPFETRFGRIGSAFTHHSNVLQHSVQALQLNFIQEGNRATEEERKQTQQQEACVNPSRKIPAPAALLKLIG